MDGYQAASLMEQLQARKTPLAEQLWKRVHTAWLLRGIAREVVVPLSARELKLVSKLGCSTKAPGVVDYRYLAIYRHPEYKQEVRVRSHDRPAKRRTFRIAGQGRKKFKRVKLYRIKPVTTSTKESEPSMARKSQTKKKQNTKDADDDLEDELEGLEELEDLEDEDIEEPDVDEDEDEEEEKPKAKRRKKKAPAAGGKRAKKKAVVEEDEEEDDEDDEEDEEEPAPKKSKSKKSKTSVKAGKKSKDKKKSSKGTPAAGKTTAEATGGVGTSELAEAASEIAEVEITGRDVRVYLRREGIPKDEEHGRYVWSSVKNKEFKKLAKAIAAEFGDEE
jgi:hypothetical protein